MPRTVLEADKDKATDAAAEGGSALTAATSSEKKIMLRKMYYLSCLACRWTSRDVGLSDQTVGMYLM
jgi:hypothetical protein